MIRKIHISDSLKKKLRKKKKVPQEVIDKFYWCLEQLLKNPKYPSLRHKPVHGSKDMWEFSITMNYRCVYRKSRNEAFILLVAKHEDVF
ncbi:MAG: type II toxin-antitoxin system mRNA interferase toxin, RelE/StbE family [Candidatus Omnitrophica bacterium]|nr:type II toxin-antitoxin system mRNA interferase toxin, RelE/StbE family [Candidatus Omnitrophota bacterium]